MTTWVTGASGFIGRHLVRAMAEERGGVQALCRGVPPHHLSDLPGVRWTQVDLLDAPALHRLAESSPPDRVVHLAAQSIPGVSWTDPSNTFRTNVTGTVNLLDALRRHAPASRVVVASSSSVYAPVQDRHPLTEDHPLEGATPYAISKVAQDQSARLYAARYNLRITVARPFFIIGAGKSGDAASDFARGIAEVESGRRQALAVGNLTPVRDFLPVDDAVEALQILLRMGEPGRAYNLCSGHGRSVQVLLDGLLALSVHPVPVEQDPARMRPVDELIRIGDPSRLRALGWEPRADWNATLQAVLENGRLACRP